MTYEFDDDDLKEIEKIKNKIKEFLETGEIKRYAFLKDDEKTMTIDMLSEVWGVGPKGALKLYN